MNTLPEETVTLLKELRSTNADELHAFTKALNDAGWPLRTIATATGVGHSAVAAWKRKADFETTYPIPVVPEKLLKTSTKPTKPKVEIPIEDQERITELSGMASMVRGRTPKDSPYRIAADELAELFYKYKTMGASYEVLATLAGVTRRSVAQRLEKRERDLGLSNGK